MASPVFRPFITSGMLIFSKGEINKTARSYVPLVFSSRSWTMSSDFVDIKMLLLNSICPQVKDWTLFFFAESPDVYIGDEGEEEPLRSSNVKTLERSRVFGFEGMNPMLSRANEIFNQI